MSIKSTDPIQRMLNVVYLITLLALNQFLVYGQAPGRAQTVRVTAAVTAEQVRYLAPLDVTQMRLEVFDWSGNRLYDSGVRLGSLLDWSWQDEAGNRLADGLYRCVLTFKDLSGQTSQRVGTLSRQGNEAALQVDERNSLSLSESSLATAGAAPTVWLGHDGRDARLSSGRGDLTFRSGDFFAGKDTEQMRLTADGNLGLGIARPQARLDVAGLIRTSEGIVFPDGTVQTTAALSGRSNIIGRAIDTLSAGAKLTPNSPAETSETLQGDGSFANINMAATDLGGGLRISDIRLTNNNAGLRFTATPALGASPDGAAIQFWGNNSAFGGNLFLDGGARDGASLIFRTAGTGQTITERMRVTSSGNVGIGLNNPGSPLTVAGVIQSTAGGFRFPDGTLQTTAAVGGTAVTAGTGLTAGTTGGNLILGLNTTFTDARYVLKAGDTVAGDFALNDKMLKLRTVGDNNHGMLFSNAVNGPEFRAFAGFRWTNGIAGETERMRLTGDGRLGIGTSAPSSIFEVQSTSNTARQHFFTNIGDQGGNRPEIVLRRARGTAAAPTAVQNSTILGLIGPGGHDGSGFAKNGLDDYTASVAFQATETWTSTGHGTRILFETTPNGSTSFANRMTIENNGTVNVAGTLTKGGGSFKIDHPLDPANKYLSHSFVESPDMMNIYNGNEMTDANGEVEVTLPEWFETLNRDFRYQLTVIGQFAQAIVAEKIKGNRFKIKTSLPNVEVSWQVTGIRHDPFANANRIKVEESKSAEERGKYLHAEAYGQPAAKSLATRTSEQQQQR